MLSRLYTFCILISLALSSEDPTFWRNIAQSDLNRYLSQKPNTNKARNIVLMIGDGMGPSTVTSARILKGQLQGQSGERAELSFEKFPYTALTKVYTTDFQVPDSAATMTAMVTGVKTNNKLLAVDNETVYDECQDLTNHKLSTILHWSQAAGKSTGIVTTARVTHATPAALYAASPNRNWENDHDVPLSTEPDCMDIASQLVYNASDIRVILGGGMQNFIPNNIPDPTSNIIDFKKQRFDGKSLFNDWKLDKIRRNETFRIVHTTEQLKSVTAEDTEYLLGLFHGSHMAYELDRDTSPTGEPSLAEMTETAIKVLNKNKNGFFLMVEGARIDHGHHAVKAKYALHDTLAFDAAVQKVVDMTDEADTLIIVTADHSHTMTMSGYPERGNDILGIVRKKGGEPLLADDDLPYTTLMYANGQENVHPRENLTYVDTTSERFMQNTVVELYSETHSGEDVVTYARGPMSHLLTGVKEQNVIAYVMAHASCVGDIGIPCEQGRDIPDSSSCDCNAHACSGAHSDFIPDVLALMFTILLCLLYI